MKLIYFTDSHIQTARPSQQFCVQPFYHGQTRDLFARMKSLAQNADAIIFGGDATHGGSRDATSLFFDMLAVAADDKPTYMVMGNHDTVDPAFAENFLRAAEPYPNVYLREGLYPIGDLDLVLLDNNYLSLNGTAHPLWRGEVFPVPVMEDLQANRLDRWLSITPERPAIVVIHCPTHVLPPVLVDFSNGILAGMHRYKDTLHAVLDRHPRVEHVLSGHVHFNSTQVFHNGRIHQCLGSFAEYPCPVRILEGPANNLRSRLVSLVEQEEVETVEQKEHTKDN